MTLEGVIGDIFMAIGVMNRKLSTVDAVWILGEAPTKGKLKGGTTSNRTVHQSISLHYSFLVKSRIWDTNLR